MRYRLSDIIAGPALALLIVAGGVAVLAAKPDVTPTKRARPPKWSNDVLDVFFEDARDKLVGSRPDYRTATTVVAAEANADSEMSPIQTGGTVSTWSKLIDAETIEAEIKRLAQAAANDVSAPTKFKGGAYEDCRRHFSVLAVLFAVAAEYDGAVRWSDVAPGLRDAFARAGHNCKVGTDQTYQEGVKLSQELEELIRGSRPQVSAAERSADWGQVSDRPPLMQRMDIAHEQRLTKWLANERQFRQNRDDIRHEAQLLATIADVIGREGFDYWDDEQYGQYARELREAATDIAAAADAENYDQAKHAVSRATMACTNCHDGYRE